MRAYYSKGGLREWVKQKWVDIGAPKKNGKYQPCGRKKGSKRKFKVYPSAYANMYASAVCSGKVTPGGKKKRKKAMGGGVMDMTRMRFLKGGQV